MEYSSVFSENGVSKNSSLQDSEGLSLSDNRIDASDGDTSLQDDKAPSQVSTIVTTPVLVPQSFNTETPSQVVSDNVWLFFITVNLYRIVVIPAPLNYHQQ